ncbi:MAG: hypothetical protein RBJ76_13450 [Stenomitos frigidus ULC029]
MQSGNNGRSGRRGGSIDGVGDIFQMILSHRYSPFDPTSWIVAFICMGIVGATVVGFSALNGKACAPGFNPWNPNSYVRRAGCWVHWLLKDVPTDFQEDPGLSGDGAPDAGNLVEPPSQQAAPEQPTDTAPKRLVPQNYRN